MHSLKRDSTLREAEASLARLGVDAIDLHQIHWAVDGAIVGFRRPDQVDPILTAANLELTNQDVAEIEGSTR